MIIAGINAIEQQDGFDEGCDENGPWAVKVYLVPWTQRWDFVRAVKGVTSTTGPTAPWVRTAPMVYPDTASGLLIYAKSIGIKNAGDLIPGSEPGTYGNALITVNFGMLDWSTSIDDDPLFLQSFSDDPDENESLQWATQELDYGSMYINNPRGCAGFSDGVKLDTPTTRPLNVTRLTITWHRYPQMPLTRIRTYADCLNNAKFLGGALGTVYFEGARTVVEMAADGTKTQKVQMSLKWRNQDWNNVLREDTGAWDKLIFNNISTNTPHQYKDFSALLL